MANLKNELLKCKIYRTITEYQIRWLSTSFEIPSLSYSLITTNFPEISKDEAVTLLQQWLQYETSLDISVYNKSNFNGDSNVETILKLKNLLKQLDIQINNISSLLDNEPENSDDKSAAQKQTFVVNKVENGITITFQLPPRFWMKRENVVYLSMEDAVKLRSELNNILE